MRDRRNSSLKCPIWLFTALMICAMTAVGCSPASKKYEPVNLETLGQNQNSSPLDEDGGNIESMEDEASAEEDVHAQNETMAVFSMKAGHESDGEASPEEAASETYETVDEVVVVTADVANIRESESQNARIFAQLKQGSTLRRTGVGEDWSRVTYEGKTAYVATSLIQVQEPEESAVPAAAPGNEDISGGAGLMAAIADQLTETASVEAFDGHIVAIDAGCQAKPNAEKEPIGPGAETMKAKMPEGSQGTATGIQEYELTLQVARRLKKKLEDSGYRVVMVRDSNDVNLSNAERSQLASRGGAEILIRLYANSLENSGVYGALTMCMTTQNPYNAQLHAKSYTLSKKIVDSICGQTGTKNRGVQEVDSMGEINWSEIPVSVVEMGFLSNPDEDRWLSQEAYQDKIAEGIRSAVDSYFSEGN